MGETLRMAPGQGIGARVIWTGRDIVIGIVLAIGSALALQLLFIGPALLAGYDEEDSITLGLAISSTLVWNVVLVGMVYWLVRRRGGSWTNLGWRPPWHGQAWTPGRVLAIVVPGLIGMWLIQGAYVSLVSLVGLDDLLPAEQFPAGIFDEWWLVVLLGFAVVVGAPFSEELFFRGFVFGGLRRRFGVVAPALATGSLFSIAHLQIGLLIPFSLIGMVLSVVYERSGSIWFNIALHLVFNTVSFTVLVLVPGARG